MKSRYSRMLAVLAVSALLVAGCGSQQQQSADVAVNSYKIVSQNAQVDQTYTGTVKAENSVAVHARVTGYVVEKFVKGGDQVVAGQPLYRIDSRQYESNVATAEANVARANADYQNAETDLGRYETLASQDAIARQRVDTQRSATEQAKAAVEAAKENVKAAQEELAAAKDPKSKEEAEKTLKQAEQDLKDAEEALDQADEDYYSYVADREAEEVRVLRRQIAKDKADGKDTTALEEELDIALNGVKPAVNEVNPYEGPVTGFNGVPADNSNPGHQGDGEPRQGNRPTSGSTTPSTPANETPATPASGTDTPATPTAETPATPAVAPAVAGTSQDNTYQAPAAKAEDKKELPNTGGKDNAAIASLGFLGLLLGALPFVKRKN